MATQQGMGQAKTRNPSTCCFPRQIGREPRENWDLNWFPRGMLPWHKMCPFDWLTIFSLAPSFFLNVKVKMSLKSHCIPLHLGDYHFCLQCTGCTQIQIIIFRNFILFPPFSKAIYHWNQLTQLVQSFPYCLIMFSSHKGFTRAQLPCRQSGSAHLEYTSLIHEDLTCQVLCHLN